jgi:NAD(P)-dependent dehydrogenase (short-subunit alcohol dehydrogenase family)
LNPLSGQTAIITGGSSEVAGAIAQALARAGVRVCLTGKTADTLERTAAIIARAGGECLPLPSFLASLEEAEAVAARARLAFGRLDLLILSAGMWGGGMLHEHSLKTWDLVMSANLREPFLMARAVLPLFRQQGRGEILAVSSDSALGAYPREGAFSVAMHGLNAMMELIRAENSEAGIRTHILCPGLALTPVADADAAVPPALSPADVADWVLWLLTRPAHLRGSGPLVI